MDNVDIHHTNNAVANTLFMYRMMVMFNQLVEVPSHLINNYNNNNYNNYNINSNGGGYSIHYTLFN